MITNGTPVLFCHGDGVTPWEATYTVPAGLAAIITCVTGSIQSDTTALTWIILVNGNTIMAGASYNFFELDVIYHPMLMIPLNSGDVIDISMASSGAGDSGALVVSGWLYTENLGIPFGASFQ